MGNATVEVMNAERTHWVMRWPGQVVIAGSQAFWTAGVEEGIKGGNLEKFHQDVMLYNVSQKEYITYLMWLWNKQYEKLTGTGFFFESSIPYHIIIPRNSI